ncbi:unannotated protein [freshwater metagenome]|uniref:Unannotated protein n=1 Tax=freshwater metagenome TaxID=449393 RepID=A0A6J6GKI2_9ZZZZ
MQRSALNNKLARTDCSFSIFKTHHNGTLEHNHEIKGVGGVHAGSSGVIASDPQPRGVGISADRNSGHANDTGAGTTWWRLESEPRIVFVG